MGGIAGTGGAGATAGSAGASGAGGTGGSPATCTDANLNGDETDVDCGGSCPPCLDGSKCKIGLDCDSKVCFGSYCQSPSCGDGVVNGSEVCDAGSNNGVYGGPCNLACNGPAPKCGDNVKNHATEECDGPDFGGWKCADSTFGGAGVAVCKTDCKLDTSGCTHCSTSSLFKAWNGGQPFHGFSFECGNTTMSGFGAMAYDAPSETWKGVNSNGSNETCFFSRAPSGALASREGQEDAQFTGHPASPALVTSPEPVIAWKAPNALPVQIDLVARSDRDCPGGDGDGVEVDIYVNNVVQASLYWSLPRYFAPHAFTVGNVQKNDLIRVMFNHKSSFACDTFWIKSLSFTQQDPGWCNGCDMKSPLPGKLCLKTTSPVVVSTTNTPHSVRVLDVNNDRHLDLVVSGGAGIEFFFGNGDGTFQPGQLTSNACGNTKDIEFVKLGPVSQPGLVATCTDSFLTGNNSGGTFTFSPKVVTGAEWIEAGFFDQDAYPDVVLGNNSASDPLQICLGVAGGQFGSCSSVASGGVSGNTKVFLADLNRDRTLDVIASGSLGFDASTFLGAGDGTFGARQSNLTGFEVMLVTDLDRDNKPDVLGVVPANNHTFGIYQGVGDGTFGTNLYSSTATNACKHVFKADLNSDGLPDMLLSEGGLPGAEPAYYEVYPTFAPPLPYSVYPAPWQANLGSTTAGAAVSADVNEDGAQDVIIPLPDSKTIHIYTSHP